MNKTHLAYGQVALASVFWSTAGIWIKAIDANPLSISGFRAVFAALTILTFMIVTRQKFIVNKKTLIPSLFMCGSFITFVIANKMTTAANAIVLQFTSPIFILAIQAFFFRQKIHKRDLITVLITFFGIFLFFLDQMSTGQIIGNILSVIAGVCMALMYVTVGNLEPDEKLSGILFGHGLTAIIGVPFAFILPFNPGSEGWMYLILLGVVQLGIPYILLGYASKNCSALACSLIAVIEPLLNPVWVAIFDGEVPGPFALIGGVIILVCISVWCVLCDKAEKQGQNHSC